jgi:hypothetical protein
MSQDMYMNGAMMKVEMALKLLELSHDELTAEEMDRFVMTLHTSLITDLKMWLEDANKVQTHVLKEREFPHDRV